MMAMRRLTLALAAALVATAPVAVQGTRGGDDVEGTYVLADVQYAQGSEGAGPEHIDNIEIDGKFHELVNPPPGIELAKEFASGLSKMQLPRGFIMRKDGKIDMRGRPAKKPAHANGGQSGQPDPTFEGGEAAARGAQSRHLLDDENSRRTPEQERNLSELRRRLATTGTRSVLVVRVKGADAETSFTEAEISDEVFGTGTDQVNLKSQYNACSHGQLTFEPSTYSNNGVSPNDGVHTVTISNTIAGATDGTIRSAALSQLQSDFGGVSASALADHVMICIPPGTAGSWIGYGYINSYATVYNDNWCGYPSMGMHEIGHNLNLGHSSEGTNTYGDQSCMMGYSYSKDESPQQCFNPAKNYQLGWFPDAQHYVPTTESQWVGQLKGQIDYVVGVENAAKVAVRIQTATSDLYVGYNKQAGHNSGTVEAGNQVTVHSRPAGTGYSTSNLLAKLSAPGTYDYNNGEVIIEVASIDTAAGGLAEVCIRRQGADQCGTASPTTPVTPNPTNPPTTPPPTNPPTTPPPTDHPTNPPPTKSPTSEPTLSPTSSAQPSKSPTSRPTNEPIDFSCSTLLQDPCKAHATCAWPQTGPNKICYCPNGVTCLSEEAPVTPQPTKFPTSFPTKQPTSFPTDFPTKNPSSSPSKGPTASPNHSSNSPTSSPSANPSSSPTKPPTTSPSMPPTRSPTTSPSASPTTHSPTGSPTPAPTRRPAADPVTESPSVSPSKSPTKAPTVHPTSNPTSSPSKKPSEFPTSAPSKSPSARPSDSPSKSPTAKPSSDPTDGPSAKPTSDPTSAPSKSPSARPSESPSKSPTAKPSSDPTDGPTASPTKEPTTSPSASPTSHPTDQVSEPLQGPNQEISSPTMAPTQGPTVTPTRSPSRSPTPGPTRSPSRGPSPSPTAFPTSANPTRHPTDQPTKQPTARYACPSIAPVQNSNDCTVASAQCQYVSDGRNGKCCRNLDEAAACPATATADKNPKSAAYHPDGMESALLRDIIAAGDMCRGTGSCSGGTGSGREAPQVLPPPQ